MRAKARGSSTSKLFWRGGHSLNDFKNSARRRRQGSTRGPLPLVKTGSLVEALARIKLQVGDERGEEFFLHSIEPFIRLDEEELLVGLGDQSPVSISLLNSQSAS